MFGCLKCHRFLQQGLGDALLFILAIVFQTPSCWGLNLFFKWWVLGWEVPENCNMCRDHDFLSGTKDWDWASFFSLFILDFFGLYIILNNILIGCWSISLAVVLASCIAPCRWDFPACYSDLVTCWTLLLAIKCCHISFAVQGSHRLDCCWAC